MRAADLDPECLYNEHFAPLVTSALASVPIAHAEQIAHEVLLALLVCQSRIENVEVWLSGALQSAIAAGRKAGA